MAGSAVSWLGSTVVVCAMLTACGGSPAGSHTTPSTSASASTSSTAPAQSATSSAPTTSASTTTPTPTPRMPATSAARAGGVCTNPDLSVSAGRSRAASGHVGVSVVFRNVSHRACRLFGYPGVAALDSQGRQVAQARRSRDGYLGGTYLLRAVVVPAGGFASALVEGSDVPSGSQASCTTYSGLLVTPPAQTQSHQLHISFPGCPTIEVHPIVAGVDGRA